MTATIVRTPIAVCLSLVMLLAMAPSAASYSGHTPCTDYLVLESHASGWVDHWIDGNHTGSWNNGSMITSNVSGGDAVSGYWNVNTTDWVNYAHATCTDGGGGGGDGGGDGGGGIEDPCQPGYNCPPVN
jgi:hypothetical protein